MAFLNVSSQFCVFCYKTIDPSVNTAEASYEIKKFVKLLSRFVKCPDIEQDTLSGEHCSIVKFLKCCASCKKIVDTCCELYHQLKLLEMQLDFRLGNLFDRIDHANKVPTRWLSLINVLEHFYPSDKGKQVECQNLIRSLRQNVLKAGHRRKVQSLPRVVLAKQEKISRFSEDEITDLEDNEDCLSETDSIKLPMNRFRNCDMDTRKLRRECKDKICPKCGKQLKSFKGLYVHLEHHKDQSEWKWQCGECEKKFSTKINLTTHLKTHTAEKTFVCRFCGCTYRYRHGLKRHLLHIHINEEGVREEINTKYYRKRIGSFETKKTVSKNVFQKYKQKYLVRKKGSTKILYYQKSKRATNFNEYFKDDESDNGNDNVSTSFAGNGDVIVQMEDDIGNPVVVTDEMEIYSSNEIHDERESPAVDVFSDPQIQIKLEHQGISEDFHESLENISTANQFQNYNKIEDTSQSNGKTQPTTISTKAEISTLNQQQSRYSLREKRTSKFTNLEETETEIHTNIDTEFDVDNCSIESFESEPEEESGYRFIRKNVRRRRILNSEPLEPMSKSEPKSLIIKCEICSREFMSFLKKEYHFKIHHDLSRRAERGIYRCKKVRCTAYFLSNQQLYFHYDREHNVKRKKRDGKSDNDKKRFICPLCGKGFPGNNSLNTHLEYHKDPSEWKWECGLCGKKSATEYKLKDHMRTHTNEKPYSCRFCKEKFRSDYKYKEHLNMDHKDEEDIKTELESKRVRVKGSQGFKKRKTVVQRKRKIIGNATTEIEKKQVELKDQKGVAFELKQELDTDVVFNELEQIAGDEYREEGRDEQEECMEQESTIDEIEREIGEEDKFDKNGETVNEAMNGVNYGGVNIFDKGDYFGDGTLAEFEDLE